MSSLATIGRMRASAGLVAAVATMVTVSCTLVALVPVYSSTIVDAGLRGTIADASPQQRAIDVTTRGPASDVDQVFDALVPETFASDPDSFTSAAIAESGAYSIVAPDVAGTTDLTIVTSLATLNADDLLSDAPELPAVAATQPMPAALHVDAAALLGLHVGDTVTLSGNQAGGDTTEVAIVALVEPVDTADARWFGEALGRLGTTATGSFLEVGPFFVGTQAFAQLAGDASFIGRFAVDEDAIGPDDLDPLADDVSGAANAFDEALTPLATRVETSLDDLLADTDTSVRSTSAVVAAILLQLATVALYGLAVAATVLVTARRSEIALLQSRGIGSRQVARQSLAEAAIISVPAALVGPYLAVAAVGLVGSVGPLEATGLDLKARVSPLAFAASLLTAVVAVAIIVWPAITAFRERPDSAANGGRGFLQRTGLDIVLVVAAVLGLWQLHRTGSVATSSTPDGRSSVDPVLVLAPTLGIAAASLLTIRLLAAVARSLERVGTRNRNLAPALAGWEVARHPARRGRSAVLVVIAVAVASFALVHAFSWQESQQAQADAAVGADLVVVPDVRPDAAVPADELPTAYRSLDGIGSVAPIDDRVTSLSAALPSVPIVAVDSADFPEFSRTRHDIVAAPDEVVALSAPADLDGVELDPAGGVVSASVSVDAIEPTEVELVLVVVDEFGTFHRLTGRPRPASGQGRIEVEFGTLQPSAPGGRPPELVELRVSAPATFVDPDLLDSDGDGVADTAPQDEPGNEIAIRVYDLRVGGAPVAPSTATWTAVAPAPVRDTVVAAAASIGSADGDTEFGLDTGLSFRPQTRVTARYLTADLDAASETDARVDVLATPELLSTAGLSVGDDTTTQIGGARVTLHIAGTTPRVPFAVDDDAALLVDRRTLLTAEYLATDTRSQPDRWALTADEAGHTELAATLAATPFDSVEVHDRWAAAQDRTRDPVLVGLAGSLLMAIGAVAIVAGVGLAMTAVTGARERRSAHAILRALGTSRSSLRDALRREIVPLGLVSTIVGAASGIVVAAVVLDALTGDRDGSPAIPPPELVIPWLALGVVAGVAIGAVSLLPFVMGRLLRGVRPADELRIGDRG